MQESTLIELEKVFLALSDRTRLRLLALMADGEVPVGHLTDTLGESQPKISRHLAYLRNCGLVSTRRDGKWVYYGIRDQSDRIVNNVLEAALGSRPEHVPTSDCVETGISGDGYMSYEDDRNISPETYMDEWTPAEMEIHLL